MKLIALEGKRLDETIVDAEFDEVFVMTVPVPSLAKVKEYMKTAIKPLGTLFDITVS